MPERAGLLRSRLARHLPAPRQGRPHGVQQAPGITTTDCQTGAPEKRPAGSRKRFRVRYDKIVAFEPFSDGFGIMRDAQTAKPQTFRTGDGWFPYNLAANLAQVQG